MKTMTMAAIWVLTCATSMAEMWPTLDQYVKTCDLIVLCETEMVDGKPIFKVVEEWKGTYSPTNFNAHLQSRIPKPGYLPDSLGLASGRKSNTGQKVVFFFTPAKDKYSGSSTSFDVRDERLIYAETGWDMAKEYTLPDFRAAVLGLVKEGK